jgi:hypothetical protein
MKVIADIDMRRIHFVTVISISFLLSCESGQKENAETGKKTDTVKVVDEIRSNTSFLYDLRALEDLFSNDNWLIPGKKDSSYFYFSRTGDFKVNTYEYILAKGDSAKVKYTHVVQEGDKLSWNFDGKKLLLSNATAARSLWTVAGNDSLRYEFLRVDKNTVRLTYPDKKEVVMKKLLPFSLFLVRSRYDFSNGTHYAFDTTQFRQKK